MSDQEVPPGSMRVRFPDGTSRVFKGAPDEIKVQAKTYWQAKHPAPKTTAPPSQPSAPAAPSRQQIDEFRLKYFNDFGNGSIPQQTAAALAKNPNDPSWNARLKLMAPVSRAAIRERIAELRKEQDDFGGDPEKGIPPSYPRAEPHDIILEQILGPEGARQVKSAKGFWPEYRAGLLEGAASMADPQNMAMIAAGGGIAKIGGKWAARAVTGTFATAAGKSAYDNLRAGHIGKAAADLTFAAGIVGGHALAEKAGSRPKGPPPPRPTKVRVEPSTRGPGSGPESPRSEPPPRPGPSRPSPDAPRTEPPPRDAGAQERQRQADAQQEQARRAREAQNRNYQRRREQQQRARNQAPPPQAGPAPEYVPVDPGTPHPEVDKFNTGVDRRVPGVRETTEIAASKKRLSELQARNKLTVNEKAERIRLGDQIALHTQGLRDFATRYKTAVGREPGIKVGDETLNTSPSGRTEVLDKIRQALRSGKTTFDKMFPEERQAREQEAQAKKQQAEEEELRARREKVAAEVERVRKMREQEEQERNAAPSSPPESASEPAATAASPSVDFEAWVDRQPHGPIVTLGDDLFKAFKAEHPAKITRAQFGQMLHDLPRDKWNITSTSSSGRGYFTAVDSTGTPRKFGGISRAVSSTTVPEQPSTDVPRETSKPPYEMSFEELEIAHKAEKSHELGAAKRVFGPGGAAQYEAAQRISNNSMLSSTDPKVKSSDALIDSMEKGLTELQRKDLFGVGSDSPSSETYRDYLRVLGNLGWESPSDLGSSLRTHVTNLGEGVDPVTMTHSERLSYAAIRHAMEGAQNKGWSVSEVWKSALEGAAGRFKDPEDATFMLRRFVSRPVRTGRFSALDQDEDTVVTQEFSPSQPEQAPQSKDAEPVAEEAPVKPKKVSKTRLRNAGFANLFADSPPKSGAGPVGRLLPHGKKILDSGNVLDAAKMTARVRAGFMVDRLLGGLTDPERDQLGEWLIGQQSNWAARMGRTQKIREDAANHPQYLNDADLARIVSNPAIRNAVEYYKNSVKPAIDEIAEAAGVTLDPNPYYIHLADPDVVARGASTGSRAPWESRPRPRSTGAARARKFKLKAYSTDVAGILRHDLMDKEPKARLNDFWRILDQEGKIAVAPRGGHDWAPPEGYAMMSIRGKGPLTPKDVFQGKYKDREYVHIPEDIADVMREIMGLKPKTIGRVKYVVRKVTNAATSAALAINPIAAIGHIYRQTGMLRAKSQMADVKRNPIGGLLGAALPPLGTVAKMGVVGFRDMDNPIYQDILLDLVKNNVISPRSMEGLTGPLAKVPVLNRVSAFMHDSMFGMPHGKGVNGWAMRVALEMHLARKQYQGTDDHEADRLVIAGLGHYTERLAPWLGGLSEANPFVRTHMARVESSLRLAVGDTRMDPPRSPGDSDSTYAAKKALNRIGNFALTAMGVVVSLAALNYLFSRKWPWENPKGHELSINTGHGFIPIWRFIPELGPVAEVTGVASRMHREQQQSTGSMSSSLPTGTSSFKMSMPSSPNIVGDMLIDTGIGVANTGLGAVDSPATQDLTGLLADRRPYLQYDKRQKRPDFMPFNSTKASALQRSVNLVGSATGIGPFFPPAWKGYNDSGTWNIGKGVWGYLSQNAIKSDHARSKGMKASKVKSR